MKGDCPHCGREMNIRAQQIPRELKPKDFVMCLGCLELCKFNEARMFEKASESDLPLQVKQALDVYRHIQKTCKIVYTAPKNIH